MNTKALAFLVGALLTLFGVYFGFRFRDFVVGPQVSILEPQDGETLVSDRVVVRGQGNDIAKMELNGRPIFIDEKGEFAEPLLLAPGINIIELRAFGRFGRELRVRRLVLVRSDNDITTNF